MLKSSVLTMRKEHPERSWFMTTDQIRYWENVERRRAAIASERENRRANEAREKETNRSNRVNEQLKAAEIAEKARATAQSGINATKAAEASRYGADQSYRASSYATAQRERDSSRSHQRGVESNRLTQENNQRNIQLGFSNLANTRELREQELSETARSNRAREAENRRQTDVKRQEANTSRAQLSESIRHNLATEQNQIIQSHMSLLGSVLNSAGRIIGRSR